MFEFFVDKGSTNPREYLFNGVVSTSIDQTKALSHGCRHPNKKPMVAGMIEWMNVYRLIK